MSRDFPIEVLLRPPVERWPAFASYGAAATLIMAPGTFLMPPGIAYTAASVLGVYGWLRHRAARRVLRYQRHLRQVPNYQIATKKIPWSRHRLFLGKGFRWTQTHTQRLRDAMSPSARHYVEPTAIYRWARLKEVQWEHTFVLSLLAKALRGKSGWNPVAPLPDVGGVAAIHGVEPDEQEVWSNLVERVGHALVLGTTRVGKTRLAEILISQDIRRGDVVVVFDPKGDAGLLRRVYIEAMLSNRLDQLRIFHLGFPTVSARYNPVGQFIRITEAATRITEPLPDQGNSSAFKQFAWRFSNSVVRALVALGRKPDLQAIQRHVANIEPLFVEYTEHWLNQSGPKDWRSQVQKIESAVPGNKDLLFTYKGRGYRAIALAQYLQSSQIYDPVTDSLRGAFTYDRTFFDKLVASLLPLLEKLTSGPIAELLVPNYNDMRDTRPIIDWMQVIRTGGIVYVGLDALADKAVAEAVGNAMFADLTSVAGQIYKHGHTHGLPTLDSSKANVIPKLSLHADEFNEIVGDQFVPMLNKAGGAGFQVTAYTQTLSDIEARFGSRAKAGQSVGNFNTLIMLRVKEQATAELLTKQLRDVEVSTLVEVSGASDSSTPGDGVDFTSRNEDRIAVLQVPMLSPSDVMALPKGQAFALLDGGQVWKIRMPLPDTRRDPTLPDSIEAMAAAMSEQYQRGGDLDAHLPTQHAGYHSSHLPIGAASFTNDEQRQWVDDGPDRFFEALANEVSDSVHANSTINSDETEAA